MKKDKNYYDRKAANLNIFIIYVIFSLLLIAYGAINNTLFDIVIGIIILIISYLNYLANNNIEQNRPFKKEE